MHTYTHTCMYTYVHTHMVVRQMCKGLYPLYVVYSNYDFNREKMLFFPRSFSGPVSIHQCDGDADDAASLLHYIFHDICSITSFIIWSYEKKIDIFHHMIILVNRNGAKKKSTSFIIWSYLWPRFDSPIWWYDDEYDDMMKDVMQQRRCIVYCIIFMHSFMRSVCTAHMYALLICMHSLCVCTLYMYALIICMHSLCVCTAHMYALLICMHSLYVCTPYVYALIICMHCLMRSAYRDHKVRCCIVYCIICTHSLFCWRDHMMHHMCASRWYLCICISSPLDYILSRGGGLGSRPIFKKFNEPYAPS